MEIKVNSALKMYALECFDVTAAHKKAMNADAGCCGGCDNGVKERTSSK